ncbi:hypothetical protein ACH5RR_025432 [Cinchona calisaya]|uniref:Uncharacterized protein n=1 Tax=Cinchona calisaya TaxID=153742 RepID=A0ABD2Z2Z9_9GENT
MPNKQKQKKKLVQIQDDNLDLESDKVDIEGSERHRNEDIDMNTILSGFMRDAWCSGHKMKDFPQKANNNARPAKPGRNKPNPNSRIYAVMNQEVEGADDMVTGEKHGGEEDEEIGGVTKETLGDILGQHQ